MSETIPTPLDPTKAGDKFILWTSTDWALRARRVPGSKIETFEIGRRFFHAAGCISPHLNLRQSVLIGDAFAHGALKYGAVGNWRKTSVYDHIQAAGRHFEKFLSPPASEGAIDEESKLPHEALFLARVVMACTVAGETDE